MTKKIIEAFFNAVVTQNASELKSFFMPDACIRWVNTNEQFTVQEYIIANCEYPGSWQGEIERMELKGETAITAARVWLADNSASFHVASFFKFDSGKIISLDEYWGNDGAAPQWRLDKQIGRPIK